VDVQKQTEIVLAWELYQQGVSKSAIIPEVVVGNDGHKT